MALRKLHGSHSSLPPAFLPIYLSIHPPIHPSILPSFLPSFLPLSQSIFPSFERPTLTHLASTVCRGAGQALYRHCPQRNASDQEERAFLPPPPPPLALFPAGLAGRPMFTRASLEIGFYSAHGDAAERCKVGHERQREGGRRLRVGKDQRC